MGYNSRASEPGIVYAGRTGLFSTFCISIDKLHTRIASAQPAQSYINDAYPKTMNPDL